MSLQVQIGNQVFLASGRITLTPVPPSSNDWGHIGDPVCTSNDWRFVSEAACVLNEWGHILDPVC